MPGPVPRARIDDDVGPLSSIDRRPGRRLDFDQCVVRGALECPRVEHDLVVEVQHRRLALELVIDELGASAPERVPEGHAPLTEVDRVVTEARRELPRIEGGRSVGEVRVERPLDPLRVLLASVSGAMTEHSEHARVYVGAPKERCRYVGPRRIGHGFLRNRV
jgi:hypothetical protein